eukprot:TRINITY_DN9961_c0_g1_i3.p1 TRINITY_DN9961_c0_g1~~TRINITY_DN9961_c0_g1_i3.p1  ORF type:complete len:612 (+),score=94.19 TRINITY_DN9961_c0_g1_i3:76-1911(+)
MSSGGFSHDVPAFVPQTVNIPEFNPDNIPAFEPNRAASFEPSAVDAPAFQPTASVASSTADMSQLQAPVFQPTQTMSSYHSSPQLVASHPQEAAAFQPTTAAPFQPSDSIYHQDAAAHHRTASAPVGYIGQNVATHGITDPTQGLTQAMGGLVIPEAAHQSHPVQPPNELVGYFYSLGKLEQAFVAKQPHRNRTYFMDHELKRELMSRRAVAENQLADPNLPVEVDNYHSLVAMEPLKDLSRTFGLQTLNYKAFSMETHLPCLMRRVVGYQVSDAQAMRRVEPWRKLKHPNIVKIKEAFTTKDFGDSSLVLVYDFHPNAMTLRQKHLSQLGTSTIPEPVIWNYIIQLCAAIRSAHSNKLALRTVNPDKIIIVGRDRLMFSAPCIMDMLYFEDDTRLAQTLIQHQQEDLGALGQVLLSLACCCVPMQPQENMQQAFAYVAQNYSHDLFSLIQFLVTGPSHRAPVKSVNDLMPLIGARFFTHVDRQTECADVLEESLSKEAYNGHLFKLISKLNTVVDRPTPSSTNHHWQESADLYLLRLFQHYVFHQSRDGAQKPFIDMGHIVQTLAKLDARSPETVCLMTLDAKNVMIVSFEELAKALDTTFAELVKQDDS